MSEPENNQQPACFGDLKIVFPRREDGLRVTPDACMRCNRKTHCLRTAMGRSEGWRVREEMLERAYRGGVVGFFHRWSQKKTIQRIRKSDPSHS